MRPVVARCHRCISADRGGTIAPPTPPTGGGGERDVRSDGHIRRARPSLHRTGGGGGLAWGSCGRSGRHALGRAAGASCVQRLDDSRNSAIHTTYRISLRSSSLQEPRYPLLRVVAMYFDPPGGRHLSPASVVLCAPHAPLRGGEGAEGLSSGPVPRGTEEGGRPRDGGWEEASLSLHPAARPTGGPGPTPHPLSPGSGTGVRRRRPRLRARPLAVRPRFAMFVGCVSMILPQVHLRKPCYDFSFL